MVREGKEDYATEIFSDEGFKIRTGGRYLGGYIGEEDGKREWVKEKAEEWKKGVQMLSRAAKNFPQEAYAGLAHSLQHEWTFLQRVTET